MRSILILIALFFIVTTLHAAPISEDQTQKTISQIQSLQEEISLNKDNLNTQHSMLLQQQQRADALSQLLNETKIELSSDLDALKKSSKKSYGELKTTNQKIGKIQEGLSSLSSLLNHQITRIDQQEIKISTLEKKLIEQKTAMNERIQQQSHQMSALEETIATTTADFQQQIENIKGGVAGTKTDLSNLDKNMVGKVKSLNNWLAIVAVIGGIGIAIGILLRKKPSSSNDYLEKNLTQVRQKIEEENIKLDSKLIELLQSQMKLIQEQSVVPTHKEPEIDHSLQLKVGDEICRMKIRLGNMPQDVKGLKPLMKSLERLEDEFNEKGYELVDMLGKPFDDGLNVKARFIPSDDLEPGERIINKIIKPQINFNGVAIQLGDIEVMTGG